MAVRRYIDSWHIMSYDYQVSDLSGAAASMMSPNAPLYNPDPPALQMSINQTVHNCKLQLWLAKQCLRKRLTSGCGRRPRSWSASGEDHDWRAVLFPHVVRAGSDLAGRGVEVVRTQRLPARRLLRAVQTDLWCTTRPGLWDVWPLHVLRDPSSRRRALLRREDAVFHSILPYRRQRQWIHSGRHGNRTIVLAIPTTSWYPGMLPTCCFRWQWISYNEPRSVTAIVDYAKSLGVRGVFAFDSSQDTLSSNGQWNYTLMNLIADGLGGHGNATRPGPAPPSPPGPSPPGPPSPS